MPQANKPSATPSLPGAMARRTDGGPASKQAVRYAAGEPGAEDFAALQGQAAMAKTPDARPMDASALAAAAQGGQSQQQQGQGPTAMPLDMPSQLPGQPVTHGADAGPGAGSDSLILPKPVDPRQAEGAALIQRYLPDLQAALQIPGVPDSYRQFVNYLAKNARAGQ